MSVPDAVRFKVQSTLAGVYHGDEAVATTPMCVHVLTGKVSLTSTLLKESPSATSNTIPSPGAKKAKNTLSL